MLETRAIPFGRPWITDEDRRAVLEVLNGHILTHGPQCRAFEEEFGHFLRGEAHCVTVSSCMAALHLACLHFGIGPGDEVIVPAQTHTATVHAVEWVGAQPVFVDCDPQTGNVTASHIEKALTQRTKAVIIVHFAGIPCDMPEILKVAEEHDLKVIEDCALALGARWEEKHAGLFGNAGCFSFYPVKHMTTGEGGMFVSRSSDVARAVAKLRAFGVDRTHSERTIPGMYDVTSLGLNYRMSEMQAALGRTQLARMNNCLSARRRNFLALKDALARFEEFSILDSTKTECESSCYCLVLIMKRATQEKRDRFVGRLNAAGIGTSIYYPQPVPRMSYYRNKYGYEAGRYPNAERISDQSVALPVGPHLQDRDLECIIQTISKLSVEGIL